MKLTREEALRLHRQMWKDMQAALGDDPSYTQRVLFKEEWCKKHNLVADFASHRLLNRLRCVEKGEQMDDLISRHAAIDAVTDELDMIDHVPQWVFDRLEGRLKQLPPVAPKQPDLSEAYANAVFTWLMSYQIQSAQLKGRYTPYEVIGWVLNDWRKEHDAERDT